MQTEILPTPKTMDWLASPAALRIGRPLLAAAGVDVALYEYAFEMLSGLDRAKAGALIEANQDGWLAALDDVLLASFLRSAAAPVQDPMIKFSDYFLGTGWGEVGADAAGNRYRWIGPRNEARLMVRLVSGRSYRLITAVQHVDNAAIDRRLVMIDGVYLTEPGYIVQNKQAYYVCDIDRALTSRNDGRVTISYRVAARDGEQPVSMPKPPAIALSWANLSQQM